MESIKDRTPTFQNINEAEISNGKSQKIEENYNNLEKRLKEIEKNIEYFSKSNFKKFRAK